mmetsp:Transcript_52678/g.87260  ORF Transcript_52678/g.87260 Transcript_52678/m.87260 type:complete len:269 (+) Transcript_52678:359-1165(+)
MNSILPHSLEFLILKQSFDIVLKLAVAQKCALLMCVESRLTQSMHKFMHFSVDNIKLFLVIKIIHDEIDDMRRNIWMTLLVLRDKLAHPAMHQQTVARYNMHVLLAQVERVADAVHVVLPQHIFLEHDVKEFTAHVVNDTATNLAQRTIEQRTISVACDQCSNRVHHRLASQHLSAHNRVQRMNEEVGRVRTNLGMNRFTQERRKPIVARIPQQLIENGGDTQRAETALRESKSPLSIVRCFVDAIQGLHGGEPMTKRECDHASHRRE